MVKRRNEDVREREQFRLDIMVSIGVSRMKKTGVVIVEPGAKVNSKYYCEHCLSRSFLPVNQATCGRLNWRVDTIGPTCTSGRSSISHSQRYDKPSSYGECYLHRSIDKWQPNSSNLKSVDYVISENLSQWSSLSWQ